MASKLFLNNSLSIAIPKAQLGAGKTVTVKICLEKEGDPDAHNDLEAECTEGSTDYELTFARADINTGLADVMVGEKVYIHVDDGEAYHAVIDTDGHVVTNARDDDE